MTLHIRRLPGAKGQLVDPKSYPPNTVIFNPSADGRYIYLRATEHTSHDETNFAMIHDTVTQKTHIIRAPMDMLARTHNMFKGIEDLRIVVFQDRIWFTATTTHATEHQTNEMLVGHFDADLTRVERMSPVPLGPRPVKNVCPFVYGDRLRLLDTWHRAVYEVGELYEDGDSDGSWGSVGSGSGTGNGTAGSFIKFLVVKVKTLRPGAGIPNTGFRGSTSPIHLHGNTWGCIVHDIIFNDNSQLVTRLAYFHHWMEFDMERGVITAFSSPFWIAHWGIEYVSGIRKADERGGVEVYLGVQDQVAFKCATRLSDLRAGK